MKNTGVVRKSDELGRVVIPVEYRRVLGIGKHDPFEISLEGDRIVLKKYNPTCIFCESSEKIFIYHEKNVCEACLDELRKKTL